MTTSELILPFLFGLALGVVYFGGLWLTLQRLPTSQSPALLMLASLSLRMGVLLAGLFWVMQGEWERLIAATVAVLLARVIVVRLLGKPGGDLA